MSHARPTVVIIGAGFSGLLTALRLLTLADGPNVRLVERRGAFARGAAYATLDEDHLLNVRASNMSAFPERPDHFVRWLVSGGQHHPQSQFARRQQYGDYLQSMIQAAIETSPAGRLLLEPDAAVEIIRNGSRWRVSMAMGHAIDADGVVLAVGNLPPSDLPGFSPDVLACGLYHADPWRLDVEQIPKTGTGLLIGSGLTMVDVALHLAKRAPDLKLIALSRRGLLPRRHLDEGPTPLIQSPPTSETPLAMLRRVRQGGEQHDWRAVLDGLRPHVHTLWRTWSPASRQQFLRHAQPWWDVHRHRLSPPVAAKLDHLFASGQLTAAAGRIDAVREAGEALEIRWTARGSSKPLKLEASFVINCAGPNGDLTRTADPLLSSLVKSGLARPDVCRLGLDVDHRARLIHAAGDACPTLFAVGPMTRGAFWEITSVPDIRVQAAACAEDMAKVLSGVP